MPGTPATTPGHTYHLTSGRSSFFLPPSQPALSSSVLCCLSGSSLQSSEPEKRQPPSFSSNKLNLFSSPYKKFMEYKGVPCFSQFPLRKSQPRSVTVPRVQSLRNCIQSQDQGDFSSQRVLQSPPPTQDVNEEKKEEEGSPGISLK